MRTGSRPIMIAALVAAACMDRHVMVGYRMRGGVHSTPHTGVDWAGEERDPILAVSDGVVVAVNDNPAGAGICQVIKHSCSACSPSVFYSNYCHLSSALTRVGQQVRRGEKIGEMGHTGVFSNGVTHVHVDICTAPCLNGTRLEETVDPMVYDVGCFDPARQYVTHDRPVLTHPVACTGD